MQVPAADVEVVEGADPTPDGVGDPAGGGKGREEPCGREEEPLSPGVGEVETVEVGDALGRDGTHPRSVPHPAPLMGGGGASSARRGRRGRSVPGTGWAL